MSWLDYYELLKKYGGSLEKATKQELQWAKRGNPNDPVSARYLAMQKFSQDYPPF